MTMAGGSLDLAQIVNASSDVSSVSAACVVPISWLYGGHYRTLFYTAAVGIFLLPARRWITHGCFAFYTTYVGTAAVFALALHFVPEDFGLPMDAVVIPRVMIFAGWIMVCLRLCRADLFPRYAGTSYAFEAFIRVCQVVAILLDTVNEHIKTQARQLGQQVVCVPSSVLPTIPALLSANSTFHTGNKTICINPCQAALNDTSVNPYRHQIRPVCVPDLSSASPPATFEGVGEYLWVFVLAFVTSVAVCINVYIGPRTARNFLYYGLSLGNPSSNAWLLACKIVALTWYIWGFVSFFLQMAGHFLYIYWAERMLDSIPVIEPSTFIGRWGLWAGIILAGGAYTWLSRRAKDGTGPSYDSAFFHFWRGIILSPIDGCRELRKWWQDPMYNIVRSGRKATESGV